MLRCVITFILVLMFVCLLVVIIVFFAGRFGEDQLSGLGVVMSKKKEKYIKKKTGLT